MSTNGTGRAGAPSGEIGKGVSRAEETTLAAELPKLPAELPKPADGVNMDRLIGRPHLFGRVKHLRAGLLIEPLGTLILQPGGRISGYANPNEGTWIPYRHGQVEGDRAFAFVTAKNTWIPSSTWTQAMGDIPTGFFAMNPRPPGRRSSFA